MSLEIRENVLLAALTTLKIGGPARYFAAATAENDVSEAFEFAAANNLDVFVLGGGSNVLVADPGFNGLVLHIQLKGVEQSGSIFTAMSGEDWDAFVADRVAEGFAGLECLSGIPGYVGGTPVQNVGAYGQEVSETIVSVRCLDRERLEIVDISNADCRFEYRKSIFNSAERDRYVVISVSYDLLKNGEPKIVYKDLREHFIYRTPDLSELRDAILTIRRSKSMVIDDADPNSRSAGSFFKNPIVPLQKYDELAERFGFVPNFPAGDDKVKIPAAWLIERAGFPKGYVRGNAGISSNHTLALINCGGATAAEIVALKDEIQLAVNDQFGIELHPEPIFVGF